LQTNLVLRVGCGYLLNVEMPEPAVFAGSLDLVKAGEEFSYWDVPIETVGKASFLDISALWS
jgi:hypothetical protein